jgi:nucleoside-diphosphate-sugar epimerase
MSCGKPVTEDQPPAPWKDPYWITKAEGDLLVQRLIASEGLRAAIIRPGTIFGVGDHLNFGRIANKLAAGRGLVIGSGRNVLPLVYVTDVVQGLLLLADHEKALGRAFNISNDQPLTQLEFQNAIADALGVARPRLHVPYLAAYVLARAAERASSLTGQTHPVVTRHGVILYGTDNQHAIDKARTELGFAPQVSVLDGVQLAASWYAQEHAPAGTPVPAVAS